MNATDAIAAAREALNRAIVAKDANAIAELLSESYHVVTALNTQRSGREENRKSWEAMFADDPDARFERTPQRIDVNEELGLAHEAGEWNGTFRAGPTPVSIAGVYSAKWERTADGAWLLLAEIFTPLARLLLRCHPEPRRRSKDPPDRAFSVHPEGVLRRLRASG
jgi:uncharacterized protein (TIGR02246 family)